MISNPSQLLLVERSANTTVKMLTFLL